jgi:hypothetical protein
MLDIRGSELLKRHFNRPAADIVGGTAPIADPALAAREAIDADAFLEEVGRRAGRTGARGRTLRTITPAPFRSSLTPVHFGALASRPASSACARAHEIHAVS